jgi:hypothetical protein
LFGYFFVHLIGSYLSLSLYLFDDQLIDFLGFPSFGQLLKITYISVDLIPADVWKVKAKKSVQHSLKFGVTTSKTSFDYFLYSYLVYHFLPHLSPRPLLVVATRNSFPVLYGSRSIAK